MMKGASKTQGSGKEVAISSARAGGLRSSTRLLEGRQAHAGQKRSYEMGRRGFIRKLFTGVTVLTVGLGAPSILGAGEKRVAHAKVSKETKVQYETFSDPKELEPYFDNAKDKLVSIKPGEVKRIGEFEVWIARASKYGTEFKLRDGNGKEHKFTFGALQDINILEVNLGNRHPYFKSMTLFVGNKGVTYAAKTVSGYLVEGVSFVQARMRDGPIRAGLEEKEGSLFVIGSPKNLKEGDVVCQAEFGASGFSKTYFKYSKSQPPGTMVASL